MAVQFGICCGQCGERHETAARFNFVEGSEEVVRQTLLSGARRRGWTSSENVLRCPRCSPVDYEDPFNTHKREEGQMPKKKRRVTVTGSVGPVTDSVMTLDDFDQVVKKFGMPVLKIDFLQFGRRPEHHGRFKSVDVDDDGNPVRCSTCGGGFHPGQIIIFSERGAWHGPIDSACMHSRPPHHRGGNFVLNASLSVPDDDGMKKVEADWRCSTCGKAFSLGETIAYNARGMWHGPIGSACVLGRPPEQQDHALCCKKVVY